MQRDEAAMMTTGRSNDDFKIALLLLVTTLLVFARVGGHELIFYDDDLYVTENRMVLGGLSWSGVASAFTTTQAASYWHPLTWLSLMLDVQLFGPRPGALHLVNALFHGLNAALLFLVLARMTGSRWRSAFVAALFAFHPLHVESVAWVAERKDVLSTFFALLTMGAYVRYTDRPGTARYAWVALFLVLGLLSKPMLVTLPFVLLLLDYWPLGRMGGRFQPASAPGPVRPPVPLSRLIAEKLPLIAASAATSVVTAVAQKHGDVMADISLGIGLRLANALVGYARYLGKTFWPGSLSIFYPHPGPALPMWQAAGAALLLLLITALVLLRLKRSPWLGVGWFWFLGTLVPVIGLVQVGAQSIADRYTYVSLIGIFIMIAWGMPELLKGLPVPSRALWASSLLVIVVLAGLTWRQLGFWKDHETLFRHAISVTEGNCVAHNSLADYLIRKGDRDGGYEHLREAVRLCPDVEQSWYNLGVLQRQRGELPEAEHSLREALRVRPGYAEAWSNLGAVYLQSGRIPEATDALLEAARLAPDDASVRFNLGALYGKTGRLAEAIEIYREAVTLKPDFAAAWNNLGILYQNSGRMPEAVAAFRQAARLRSEPVAWYNLGIVAEKTGDLTGAIEAFREAARLAPDHPDAWYRLGLAYARMGRRQEALEVVQTLRPLDAGMAGDLGRRIGPGR
jgi:tetratricopeptide (TPR) repeat protein